MELFNNTSSSPGPDDRHPSDDEIKNKIERLYEANEIMRKLRVTVNVKNGVVALEGVVHSPQSWETAQDLAADVRGVLEVQNKLKVESGPAPTA